PRGRGLLTGFLRLLVFLRFLGFAGTLWFLGVLVRHGHLPLRVAASQFVKPPPAHPIATPGWRFRSPRGHVPSTPEPAGRAAGQPRRASSLRRAGPRARPRRSSPPQGSVRACSTASAR